MINSRFFLILLALSYCTSTFSQMPLTEQYGSKNDYKRLYYLNNLYIQSWLRSDTATYNRLLWADDFVHQNSSDGLLYPKKQIGERFGKPRFDKIAYFFPENIQIRFITNDAAMIYARTPYKSLGDTTELLSCYNDVYVRRDGQWVCVSANVTAIPKPGDPPATLTKLPKAISLPSFHAGTKADILNLRTLNDEQAAAFFGNKPTALERIWADDFIFLSPEGLLQTKQALLKSLRSDIVKTWKIENLVIRFVAADVAMVHGALIIDFPDGKTSGIQYNDIYVKRDQKWVCVAGNNTPINNL
jgi:hypothetical protein